MPRGGGVHLLCLFMYACRLNDGGLGGRKSRERACRRSAWRLFLAAPVTVCTAFGLSGWRGLCPGGEVFRVRVPGQEPFQGRAGQGLSCVTAAFVEVGGEIGDDVQAASCAVAVTVQIAAALRAESPLRELPAFFLVTTGPRIVRSARLLSRLIIE
jgi:hypothetical protein